MKQLQKKTNIIRVADQKGRLMLGSLCAGKHFAVREDPAGGITLTPIIFMPEECQPTIMVPDKDPPQLSHSLLERFAALETLYCNWDGCHSPVPSADLIISAREIVVTWYVSAMERGAHWEDPHIGANEYGHVTLEWWHGSQTLTIFIRAAEQMEYLAAWGIDVQSEMKDGTIQQPEDFLAQLDWLYEGNVQTTIDTTRARLDTEQPVADDIVLYLCVNDPARCFPDDGQGGRHISSLAFNNTSCCFWVDHTSPYEDPVSMTRILQQGMGVVALVVGELRQIVFQTDSGEVCGLEVQIPSRRDPFAGDEIVGHPMFNSAKAIERVKQALTRIAAIALLPDSLGGEV